MSLTSKQIDELRAYAKDRKGELAKLITDAADTIEMLSAKLHASQMERSSQYYHGGWIPCEEIPPKYPCIMYLKGCYPKINICSGIYTYETKKHGVFYVDAGVVKLWDTVCRKDQKSYQLETLYGNRIIAWMPLPEPYRGEGEKQ